MSVRVGYEYQPGRITYWSMREFRNLREASRWAARLNRRGQMTGVWGGPLPGRWVVRS